MVAKIREYILLSKKFSKSVVHLKQLSFQAKKKYVAQQELKNILLEIVVVLDFRCNRTTQNFISVDNIISVVCLRNKAEILQFAWQEE